MKKYMKNKDFIPEMFYDKIELKKSKKENAIVILFLIINLFLIPITASNIIDVKEKFIKNKASIYETKSNKINPNNINIWIENIINNDIKEAYITNNNGEVVVNDLEQINTLSSNGLIKIKDVTLNSSGEYKLGVSLNE